MPSNMMPSVWGSRNRAPKRRTATPQRSRSGAASARAGSCTRRQISSHASTDNTASSAKPLRQPQRSTSQASGVPVSSRPMPPMPRPTPDTNAKRELGKCREMNTVHARNAGAQPTPISNWPSSSQP